MTKAPVVIFGGTFDPIHIGHLRTAIELGDWLQVPEVRLVPSGDPVHRAGTQASAQQRLEMVSLATEYDDCLVADDIEVNSESASYTVVTLEKIRQKVGPSRPVVLVMGMDAFMHLTSWHRWQELFGLAHLLVVARPGYSPEMNSELKEEVGPRVTEFKDELKLTPSGSVVFHQLTPLGVSATQIRSLIVKGQNPRFLLPDTVWEFIKLEKLYGFKEG